MTASVSCFQNGSELLVCGGEKQQRDESQYNINVVDGWERVRSPIDQERHDDSCSCKRSKITEERNSTGGLLIIKLQISILYMHWISYTGALMLMDSRFLQYFSQTMRIFAIRTFVIRFLLTMFEICLYLLITTAEWQHIVHNIYLEYNVSVWVWTITVVSYRGQY